MYSGDFLFINTLNINNVFIYVIYLKTDVNLVLSCKLTKYEIVKILLHFKYRSLFSPVLYELLTEFFFHENSINFIGLNVKLKIY